MDPIGDKYEYIFHVTHVSINMYTVLRFMRELVRTASLCKSGVRTKQSYTYTYMSVPPKPYIGT